MTHEVIAGLFVLALIFVFSKLVNKARERHGGSADCALGAFAGVTECAVRCGEHASCADCLKHWLDEEEDGWS